MINNNKSIKIALFELLGSALKEYLQDIGFKIYLDNTENILLPGAILSIGKINIHNSSFISDMYEVDSILKFKKNINNNQELNIRNVIRIITGIKPQRIANADLRVLRFKNITITARNKTDESCLLFKSFLIE